jgi:hypothetical protein
MSESEKQKFCSHEYDSIDGVVCFNMIRELTVKGSGAKFKKPEDSYYPNLVAHDKYGNKVDYV